MLFFFQILNCLLSVPDYSGIVTARAFVTVNLLIERFEMSVYYYYYYIIIIIKKMLWPWNPGHRLLKVIESGTIQ